MKVLPNILAEYMPILEFLMCELRVSTSEHIQELIDSINLYALKDDTLREKLSVLGMSVSNITGDWHPSPQLYKTYRRLIRNRSTQQAMDSVVRSGGLMNSLSGKLEDFADFAELKVLRDYENPSLFGQDGYLYLLNGTTDNIKENMLIQQFLPAGYTFMYVSQYRPIYPNNPFSDHLTLNKLENYDDHELWYSYILDNALYSGTVYESVLNYIYITEHYRMPNESVDELPIRPDLVKEGYVDHYEEYHKRFIDSINDCAYHIYDHTDKDVRLTPPAWFYDYDFVFNQGVALHEVVHTRHIKGIDPLATPEWSYASLWIRNLTLRDLYTTRNEIIVPDNSQEHKQDIIKDNVEIDCRIQHTYADYSNILFNVGVVVTTKIRRTLSLGTLQVDRIDELNYRQNKEIVFGSVVSKDFEVLRESKDIMFISLE